MSYERALQPLPPTPQQSDSRTHIAGQSCEIGIRDSPFLTMDEGARFCRFDATCAAPAIAFRKWLLRHCVPTVRRGRALLVDRRVLESVLREM